MRLASSITPVLTGISILYSTTNNIIVSSFTPSSSSNNVVSRRLTINNKLYSSNTKNEIIDGSHQLLTVHDELDTISSTATTDIQSTQQNVVGSNNSKKMNRRQLLKQCTISSLLGIVQLSGGCNEALAEVETLKDTDVDASTLPKEATTELTKSSTTDTDTTDNIESTESKDVKPTESNTDVKSETSSATNESSTTSTKVEEADKKQETSNKKEDNEEYKAMKSIVDTYNSRKSSGSKSKVAVVGSTTPPPTATPSDALTSVIAKDLSGFILPATLLAGSATIASSILNNDFDEINGEKSILSASVRDQANEMTRKNMQKRSEWKMDTPTPYGLQEDSPKQLVPPKGSDWERIDGSVAGGNGSSGNGSSGASIVEEKKPIEPSLKGSMPKPTEKVKAQKSISMAKLVKEGTTKQQKQQKGEWKGMDQPTPYGLKSDTPKYASPNKSESVNFGEKALAAVSASKSTSSSQPLKGSTKASSSGNISMSNIVKGTEDPTQVKKKVLTLDNKGRKVWKLEESTSWIQTLATGGNSSKQKGKDWKGLPPPTSKKGGVNAAVSNSSGKKGGTNKEEVLLSVAEKKAAMKKDVQRSSVSGSASSPPPVSKVKATKSISMAKIVKGAATSPAQQQSMFNSLPTKGSSAKAPVKKSFAKTTLKGAMKAARSAIDSGTASTQQQQPTPVAKSPPPSNGGNGPIQALPTPSYSAKSNIMGGSSDNVVPVKKSFAKGSFKMKSSTPASDNKMAGSSTTPPVSGGGMESSVGTSSSSSTAASMPSSRVTTMKGSASPPLSPSSGSSSDAPVKKSFSKSSFKKSSGKGSPGGWAVSSSPIESSISASSAKPATPVAKQAAPVSLPPPPATKGTESSSPTTQGVAKSPVSAVKKSYGKSSFKGGSSSSGRAGGMLKGSSSQLFGAGPTPKSSTSFGKSVTNKKKKFGKSISMANVMKQGPSATSGGGDDGFLSGLEQSSIPSSPSTAAPPAPSSSNAAVLLPKQVSTNEPPPQVPKVETSQVTPPPKVDQVRQPPPQMPPPLGQIGNSEASGVRIGSANRFGNTPLANFAAPINRGRQQQQQQQAQTSAVAEKENEPRQTAQSIKNEETQSAAPAVTTVTITDPRTGKKRTITTSSNIRP